MAMPLVLAIEPDRRQAAHVAAVVKHRVGADLVLADTTEGALDAIGSRVPDLVLVPALLSPQDDAALAAALRVIAAAAHVRTLTIPVFSSTGSPDAGKSGGLLARFRRGKSEEPSVGCDPAVFAEQITDYLREAAAERADREGMSFDGRESAPHADETPFIESSFIESPPIDVPSSDAPWAEAQPAGASPIEPPLFDAAIEPPPFDMPIEPVRLIAPAVVTRAAQEPPRTAPADAGDHESHVSAPDRSFGFAHAAVEPIRETPLDARAQDASGGRGAAPLDFADAAAAEFGDRAFVEQPATPSSVEFEVAFEPPLVDDGDGDEIAIDFSDEAAGSSRAAAEPKDEELFDGERFGVYTLSLDESVDEPLASPDAALAEFAVPAPDAADLLQEFADEAPASTPADTSTWPALGLRHTRVWPLIEGAIVEHGPGLADVVAAGVVRSEPHAEAPQKPAPPPAPRSAPKAAPKAADGKADPLDWAELVASLRQDIERRRKQPPASPPIAAVKAPAPRPADTPPQRPQLHAIDGNGRRGRKPTPVQDEWGFFDPQQCGFAALLAKLDEFSEADEPEVRKTS
jgi:hypothetical protein